LIRCPLNHHPDFAQERADVARYLSPRPRVVR
jgi:hypothetical protein